MRTYKKIGFVGLGVMGIGMASNLLKAGYELVVYDIDKGRAQMLPEQARVAVADRSSDIFALADTVILMLPNSPHVQSALFGEGGLLEGAIPENAFIIDMSSISPVVTRDIAEKLANRGIQFLDAPVSGGQSGAAEGKLTIMVGGSKENFDDAQPLFEAMGKKIIHCGGSGAGQVVKVVNQLMSAVNLISMSEGFILGAKAGVDPQIMMDVISGGSGRCWAVENRMPVILEGNFAPGFTIDLHKKDIGLAIEMASSMNLPLPVTALVNDIFKAAQAEGKGKLDNSGIITVYEDLLGVQVRKQK